MIGISDIQRRTTNRNLHRNRLESENRPFRWAEKRKTRIQDRKKVMWAKRWRQGRPKFVQGHEQNNAAKVKGSPREKLRDGL